MKSITTIIIGIILGTNSRIEAQPSELSIALKGGANAATQLHDFRLNRYGFSGGLSGAFQHSITEPVSLGGQLELLYSPRGAETFADGANLGQVREHYMDLTITLRPELLLGRLSVYLLLGGGLNYLMSASKDDATGTGQDITDGLHRVDISMLGAAGLSLHLPHGTVGLFHLDTLFLEARHDIGLLDVDKSGGFKNRTSSLMLGLSLAVGSPSVSGAASTSQTADRFRGRSTSAR